MKSKNTENVEKSVLSGDQIIIIKKVMHIITTSENLTYSPSFIDEVCSIFIDLIKHHSGSQMSSLFILRLFFLQNFIFGAEKVCELCDLIIDMLSLSRFGSIPATVMALCCVGNLLSHEYGKRMILGHKTIEKVIDVAVGMYIYVYVHVYINVCILMYVYLRLCIYIYVYIYVFIYCIYKRRLKRYRCSCRYIYMYMYICIYIYVHKYILYTYVYIFIFVYLNIHAYRGFIT
jgi:hypothetical protein